MAEAGTMGERIRAISNTGSRFLGKEWIMAQYEAYCVKCREKRQFEGEEVTLANGRRAAQGTCPVCGTKVMRILGKAS
jgi:hypothetical protein